MFSVLLVKDKMVRVMLLWWFSGGVLYGCHGWED
jgi:hypothetical protein